MSKKIEGGYNTSQVVTFNSTDAKVQLHVKLSILTLIQKMWLNLAFPQGDHLLPRLFPSSNSKDILVIPYFFKAGAERKKELELDELKREQEKLYYHKLCWGNFGQL